MTAETRTGETSIRNRRGRYERTLHAAHRDSRAVRLRSEGSSYDEIAKILGFANRSVAFKAVQRALTAVVQPGVEQLRRLEIDRLDSIQLRLWRTLLDAQCDPAQRRETVLLLLRVMDQRAKLLGLYPAVGASNNEHPRRHSITVKYAYGQS